MSRSQKVLVQELWSVISKSFLNKLLCLVVSLCLGLYTVNIKTIILRGIISVLGKLILIENMLFLSVLSASWKLQKRGDVISDISYNHDGYYTLNEDYDDYLVQEQEYVLAFLKQSP